MWFKRLALFKAVLYRCCFYRSFLFISSTFLLHALPSSATAKKVSLVTEHYPPYQIVHGAGEIKGIHANIIKRIKQKTTLKFDEQVMPWARTYQTVLSTPNTCVYSMIRLPEREESFIWIGELGPSVEKIYATKETAKNFDIKSLADAKDYILAAQRGDLIIELLAKEGFDLKRNLMEVSDWKQTIKLILHGRAHLIISNQEILNYYFGQLYLPVDTLVPVYTLPELANAKHYLACHPETDADIIQQLKSASIAVNKELIAERE